MMRTGNKNRRGMDIAVVGSSDFVLGFKLAGIRKTYEAAPEEIQSKIEEVLNQEGIGILVIHNDTLTSLPPALRRRLSKSLKPTVIAIGSREFVGLKDRIKEAIGVDLWG